MRCIKILKSLLQNGKDKTAKASQQERFGMHEIHAQNFKISSIWKASLESFKISSIKCHTQNIKVYRLLHSYISGYMKGRFVEYHSLYTGSTTVDSYMRDVVF